MMPHADARDAADVAGADYCHAMLRELASATLLMLITPCRVPLC